MFPAAMSSSLSASKILPTLPSLSDSDCVTQKDIQFQVILSRTKSQTVACPSSLRRQFPLSYTVAMQHMHTVRREDVLRRVVRVTGQNKMVSFIFGGLCLQF